MIPSMKKNLTRTRGFILQHGHKGTLEYSYVVCVIIKITELIKGINITFVINQIIPLTINYRVLFALL